MKIGTTLITGFPNLTVRRLARLLADKGEKALLLCQPKVLERAREFGRAVSPEGRIEAMAGDVLHLDLGLSGEEVRRIHRDVRVVHHAASIDYPNAPATLTRRVNVEGTANVLDFAKDLRHLDRVVLHSTAFVAGDRTGVILEEELDEGQAFRDAWERSRFEAEVLARSRMKDLPICVVRPSLIVGDSVTGEADRLDGPYFLIRTLITFPLDVALPLPGGGIHPLNLVPVDFVAAAADGLARHPGAAGRTFHLTDPNPLSAAKVFEVIAEAAGRKRPRGRIPPLAYRMLFDLPVIGPLIRPQQHFLECFDRLALYNCMNTLECLAGTGIACPSFPRYAAAIVAHVRDRTASRKGPGQEPDEIREEDAFEPG